MIEFYDRTAYLLFVLDIPHLRGAELMSAIKLKLSSLYPGNIDERNIKIRKNGPKKCGYLVFVLDKNTGNTMLPLSPLFVQNEFSQKSGNVLYLDKQWFDYIRIENGAIVSSIVKIRDEAQLLDNVKEFCSAEDGLTIYCDPADRPLFDSINTGDNIQFFDSHTELRKTNVHKISLFKEKSPAIKLQRILISSALLVMLITCSLLLYKHRINENERNAQIRFEQEQQEKARLQQQREMQRLSELKDQYQELISAKTATPFDIAVVIAECAGQQTRIQSSTFNGSFFQIEGVSNDSLELLRKFENHRLISQARLHQVHPGNNRDAFTLSGTVLVEAVSIDDFELPINEQIALLENIIATEKNYASQENLLSPSAFGEAVKKLFTKWGCAVNSYQFMNEPHRTEVEYSLRGPGNGFFNALYEIKTNYRSWDVHLTQIRNLYPRNMLDIVVRIRTEYHQSNTSNTTTASVEVVNPYPVANISRNYFPPAPVVRAPQEPAAVKEQVVVIPAGTERVSWLEYVGRVNDDSDSRFIYVKNTRTGEMLKLGQFSEGNMRYATSSSGGFILYINDQTFEINRR